ncbi:hypothetical protein AB0O70_03270 [Microbacterium paraoxydans]|jgi:hypothetical protein|uniref:Uncharacterized protein n=1 Tax=Microbacterium paraoxydans TaxID=199592 RepID=A0A1H1LLE2_9MICO|nr:MULTISPECIES: hypothetical protein [Microbacterium]AVL96999.1 hypothetical protein C6C15_07725 [Microbacterium sp. str. 'China']SDR74679.1 hypothetical protein SAMN04489809_0169 [Microbacterium paraoxydans]
MIPWLHAAEETALDQKAVFAWYCVQGGVAGWFVMRPDSDSTQMLAFGCCAITDGELVTSV